MRARWILVVLSLVVAIAAACSDDDSTATGTGPGTGTDAGDDSSTETASGGPGMCNVILLCPCADGFSGAAGCNGQSCGAMCSDHGGACPASGPGCSCNDGTMQGTGLCNGRQCVNVCDDHCGFRDAGFTSCHGDSGADANADSGVSDASLD